MNTQSESAEKLHANIILKKLSNSFSESVFATTKLNVFNIILLSAFIIPLIYLSMNSSKSDSLLGLEYSCNPYINKIPPNHLPITTECHASVALDPTKLLMGIDVSHYQGKILWDMVASSGKTFAITKATGVETYTDPSFINNWYGIRQHELIRGAYHFFYAGDDPIIQAEHFLNTVGTIRKNDLPPILDIEISDHVSSDVLRERALAWLQKVENETQRRPIIYTDIDFGKEFLTDPRFGTYYLWLADYSNKSPTLPEVWENKDWFLLQYAEDGKVSGVEGDVDLNHYKGSIENFRTFIQQTNL